MRLLLPLILVLGSAGLSENPRAPEVDRDAFALLEQDFVAFNPHYREERESRVASTYALAKRMFEEEAKGGKTT